MANGIGFIGCSSTAFAWLRALREGNVKLSDRLVGAYDPDPSLAETLLRESGSSAKPADLLEGLLDTSGLGAVFIGLPVWEVNHAVQECTRRNIPFYMENPVSIGSDHLEPLEKEIDERFLLTCVGNDFRYLDTVAQAIEHLMHDPPVSCQMLWLLPLPSPCLAQTILRSGGVLNLYGSRLVDLSRYLFGEVHRVFAMANHTPPYANVQIDNSVQLCLGFEDHNMVNLMVAFSSTVNHPQLGVNILTRNGRLEMSGENLDLTIHENGGTTRHTSKQNVQVMQLQLFLTAVQRRDASTLRTSYQDSVRTQMVVAGAMNSLKTGAVQKLRWGGV